MSRKELKEGKVLKNIAVACDEEKGQIILKISLSDFIREGFEHGDSVDIVLNSGVKLTVPYFDRYTDFDGPYLCASSQVSPLILCYPENSSDIPVTAEGCTACINLNTPAAFAQGSLSLVKGAERRDYKSDKAFANFRYLKSGSLKAKRFYRSASPCDSQNGRNEYVDKLIKKAGIKYILLLDEGGDTLKNSLEDESMSSSYFKSLYDEGNVFSLVPGPGYREEKYKKAVGRALKELLKHEGPYLICCCQDKDRTGFICTLLQCLGSASYEEMEKEYMETFKNYYRIDKETDHRKYKMVADLYFEDMLIAICNLKTANGLRTYDYVIGAYDYLEDCGLTPDETDALLYLLTGR